MVLEDLDKSFTDMIFRFNNQRDGLVEVSVDKLYQKVIQNRSQTLKEDVMELEKGVRKTVNLEEGYGIIEPDWKAAPDTYFMENGYRILQDGQVVGWEQGRYMYRNATNELQEVLEQEAEQMIKKLAGDTF